MKTSTFHSNRHALFKFIYCPFSVRPEVRPVPSSGILTVKTGESASLGCEVVRGSPAPEVKWHRRERKVHTQITHEGISQLTLNKYIYQSVMLKK